MATPTAGKHAPVAMATPPVSTPFSASNHPSHPAFSPHGPRSVVLSPQQVKKSPANSNTMFGYPGGAGGHPTNSSFGGGGYDSPSAAMALGGVSVSGLDGLGLDSMAVGMATPMGVGSVGLGMGVVVNVGGVGGEEGKRRKLEEVTEILKANKGRLSEAGIERLAKRVGLECFWEDHVGSGKATRTLIIAGSALALDIDFENNVVKKVALSFPESPESVTRHTKAAGDILLRDLGFGPHESPLTKKLDRFAANLERLATLDKLSVIPGLNCLEAIAGIYESIERLHLWEVERLKESEEMNGKDQEYAVKTATYTKSGKPVMHSSDRLGMSLDYWQENRWLKGSSKQKSYALLIECAPLPSLAYPPLRVSEHWISAEIQKANDPTEELFMTSGNGPVLDWIQPDNTLLPPADQPKVDAMEGVDQATGQRFPEVMFVAKFDPPLIVPCSTAVHVYNSTGIPMDPFTTIYDELLIPRRPEDLKAEPRPNLCRETTIPIFSADGEKSTIIHRGNLFIEKSDYGRILTELPFSHPQQLVEWLPALRQAAFLASLLQKSFGSASQSLKPDDKDKNKQSYKDDFENFMTKPLTTESRPVRVDIKLDTQPVPRLDVHFPFEKAHDRKAHVVFEIKLNAVVEIISQNFLDESMNGNGDVMDEGNRKVKGRKLTVADLARMLEVTEDLGIWIEFVKRRLG